jgi:hypothetical protein
MKLWSSITTTDSPIWQILGHSRYLRSLGAHRPIYFLDKPEIYSKTDLCELMKTSRYVFCDEKYWNAYGGKPLSLAKRQLVNLHAARKSCTCQWHLHVDMDEYLYLNDCFFELIKSVPREVSEVRLQNFERVMLRGASNWHEGVFRVPSHSCGSNDNVADFIMPFLGMGLANYYHGKSFVRNSRNIIQGIHGAIRMSHFEVIRFNLPWHLGFIAHYQYLGEEQFFNRMKSVNLRMSGRLAHEVAQLRWLQARNFTREDVNKLGSALFEVDCGDVDIMVKRKTFCKIPDDVTRNIQSSFEHEKLTL